MSSSSISYSSSCLQEYWNSLESVSEAAETCSESCASTTSSIFSSSKDFSVKSMKATSNSVSWMLENRLGISFVSGILMVPSQFMGPNAEESAAILTQVCQPGWDGDVNAELGTVQKNGIALNYLIYYPKGRAASNNEQCVLYNNPNGVTVAQYFSSGTIDWTPANVAELEKRPLVLFDYRGTGHNKKCEVNSSMMSTFKPTYQSVVDDGIMMLKHVLSKFKKVSVWGSSLGGGVATKAVDNCIIDNPSYTERLSLTTHDSFTTTPEVIFPKLGMVARFAGTCIGANMDAATSIRNLLTTNIAITILCHLNDPVIPAGARMAELALSIKVLSQSEGNTYPTPEQMSDFSNQMYTVDNVKIFISDREGHANLSTDMMRALRKL